MVFFHWHKEPCHPVNKCFSITEKATQTQPVPKLLDARSKSRLQLSLLHIRFLTGQKLSPKVPRLCGHESERRVVINCGERTAHQKQNYTELHWKIKACFKFCAITVWFMSLYDISIVSLACDCMC